MAWIHGVAAVGLPLGPDWGYKLACVPGSLLGYQSRYTWLWETDRRAAGQGISTDTFGLAWYSANLISWARAGAAAWIGLARHNERGTAYADLTHFFAGIAFVWLAIAGNETALIFGLYTCSIYLFVMTQYLVQPVLLTGQNLHPVSKDQIGFYAGYAGLFIAFGLYGLSYLWEIASA